MADIKENKVIKRTDKETISMKQENNIPFFNEKKWIMAYWFKRSRKTEFTVKYLREQWIKWWKSDAVNISDEMLQEISLWIKETVCPMTMDEVKKKRHEAANKSPVLPFLKRLAKRKGYYIKKCSTRNHPLKVSGYACSQHNVFFDGMDNINIMSNSFHCLHIQHTVFEIDIA